MSIAPSHGPASHSAPLSQTTPLAIATLRASLPEPLRKAIQDLSSTPTVQFHLHRRVLQETFRQPTPTDDGCSATCGSTCCDE